MTAKKRGLGRGLEALISSNPVSISELTQQQDELKEIPVEFIERGKYQPRREMQTEKLEELAASIKAQGIMQPIIVQQLESQRYGIIAGERRWRAAQLAGLEKVPAIVRDVKEDAVMAMALIENIQREDLNPIDEAIALQRLQEECHLTHQEVAEAVGRSRAAVTNLLRLLNLAEPVKLLLEQGHIEMGHAKALLALEPLKQQEAASAIVNKDLSVRQTELLVKRLKTEKSAEKVAAGMTQQSKDITRLEETLSTKIGVPVSIQHNAKGQGKLIFKYTSLDELDGILERIG